MSAKTSRETEIPHNGQEFESGSCGVDATGESTALAELILKAACIWHRHNAGKTHSSEISPEEPENLKETEVIILSFLNKAGEAPPSTLAKAVGKSEPTIQRYLKSLLKKGLVAKTGQTRGVRYDLPKHKNGHG